MQHDPISTQQVFGPYGQHRKPGTVACSPGSGTIDVEIFVSGDTENPGSAQFATLETLSPGAAREVKLANRMFRVTPTGGATYTFVERILPGQ